MGYYSVQDAAIVVILDRCRRVIFDCECRYRFRILAEKRDRMLRADFKLFEIKIYKIENGTITETDMLVGAVPLEK